MKKSILAFAGAILLAVSTTEARAQAINPDDGQQTCVLDIFVSYTPTKCVGFFGKNSMDFGTGYNLTSADDAYEALDLMGLDPLVSVYEKIDKWNGTGDFAKAMTGLTVVGVHWGNYGAPQDAVGNVSAFYLLDFGANSVTDLNLKSEFLSGVSNAATIYTGGGSIEECGGTTGIPCTTVPEPSTYALMGAGLLALGFVSRRRRLQA